MRKIVLFCILLSPLVYSTTPLEATIADTLASYDIIVNNSKNPAGYRLADTITRAEATGVALRVADISLPDKYFCKNYFRDVSYNPVNNWICRAIEIASDSGIISRENTTARPNTPISRIEALAITMRAGRIPYARNVDRKNYPVSMPQWQIDLLEWALQYGIISSIKNFGPDMLATRIDVFGMIYNMRFAGTKIEYITDMSTPPGPLGSAPDSEWIIVTLPGTNSDSTSSETNVSNTKTLAGFAVNVSKDIKTNTPFDISIKALDQYGDILTNYTGTIYFDLIVGTYADVPPITLDEWYTFTLTNNGVITLKNIIIKKAGIYELDVYEIASGADIVKPFFITVTDIAPTPAQIQATKTISSINVTAPTESVINTPFDITVTIINSAGQVLTDYTGTIYFWTNNLEVDVLFPTKSYTFTAADKGKKIFKGIQLKQIGMYELVIYEVDTIPNGTSKTVKITAKNPTN